MGVTVVGLWRNTRNTLEHAVALERAHHGWFKEETNTAKILPRVNSCVHRLGLGRHVSQKTVDIPLSLALDNLKKLTESLRNRLKILGDCGFLVDSRDVLFYGGKLVESLLICVPCGLHRGPVLFDGGP